MFDLDYAKEFCNKLNEALENKTCKDIPENTSEFRLNHLTNNVCIDVLETRKRY